MIADVSPNISKQFVPRRSLANWKVVKVVVIVAHSLHFINFAYFIDGRSCCWKQLRVCKGSLQFSKYLFMWGHDHLPIVSSEGLSSMPGTGSSVGVGEALLFGIPKGSNRWATASSKSPLDFLVVLIVMQFDFWGGLFILSFKVPLSLSCFATMGSLQRDSTIYQTNETLNCNSVLLPVYAYTRILYIQYSN